MSLKSRLFALWRNLAQRERVDHDLDDEVRAMFELLVDEKIRAGAHPDEARRAAVLELGRPESIKDEVKNVRAGALVETMLQDVRYALRTLRRYPGFTAAAVTSLALGVGATTAAFSLADAILLRPLPVADPSGVYTIATASADHGLEQISHPDLLDLQQRAQSFDVVVAYRTRRVAFEGPADPAPRVRFGHLVSSDFFRALGVEPVLGRAFTEDETRPPGPDRVVILSNEFWRTNFGADERVIGTTVRINGDPFVVVGVTPERFTGLNQFIRPAFYVPITMLDGVSPSERRMLEDRSDRGFIVKARLRPGVSRAEAQAELSVLASALERTFPETNRGRTFTVRTELQARAQDAPALVIVAGLLLAVAAIVFVIASLNVATLLLARSGARAREIAVRAAIGAGGGRLLRQLLTECVVLSLCAGAAGVAVAWGAIHVLASIQLPTDTPIVLDVRLDHRILLFGLAASIASALVFGLVPAWRAASPDLISTLKSEPGGDGRLRLAGRKVLVVGQVALSLVLLVVAAALLEAFQRMTFLDPGVRTDGVVMMEFEPALIGYSPDQTREFYRVLVERAVGVPGVRSAALASGIPFRPNFFDLEVVPEGYQFPADQRTATVSANAVGQGYFETMGIGLLRGRAFTSADTATSRPVVVINQEFAARYWPGEEPLGKHIRFGADGPYAEVVGVTPTGKYRSLEEPPQPYLYVPFSQHPRDRMTLLVHTAAAPGATINSLEQVVKDLDPNQPLSNVRDFQTYFERGPLAVPRLAMQMVGAAGLVGLALAVVGLYGLVAYSVSRRTREIAIRMAVGATHGDVVRFVLRQGAVLSLIGAAIGLAASVPVFRALTAALAGVGALSPWTLVIVPGVLTLVALAACWIPARRATHIPAVTALRYE